MREMCNSSHHAGNRRLQYVLNPFLSTLFSLSPPCLSWFPSLSLNSSFLYCFIFLFPSYLAYTVTFSIKIDMCRYKRLCKCAIDIFFTTQWNKLLKYAPWLCPQLSLVCFLIAVFNCDDSCEEYSDGMLTVSVNAYRQPIQFIVYV